MARPPAPSDLGLSGHLGPVANARAEADRLLIDGDQITSGGVAVLSSHVGEAPRCRHPLPGMGRET